MYCLVVLIHLIDETSIICFNIKTKIKMFASLSLDPHPETCFSLPPTPIPHSQRMRPNLIRLPNLD